MTCLKPESSKLPRRHFLGQALALPPALGLATSAFSIRGLAAPPANPLATAFATAWQAYRNNFITPQGRVVDTGNGNISHTEGQGVSMLLAVAMNDRVTFEHLWEWTRTRMQRTDRLFSWKWEQGGSDPAEGKITDTNNATDGDLFIAWALARAGKRWKHNEFTSAARSITIAVREKLVIVTRHGLILLPAEIGFARGEKEKQIYIINLSYWLYPAFPELAKLDPAPVWKALADNGLAMLGYARFGRWQLPPDWLLLSDPVTVAGEIDQRFAYNAIRIPLYLIWAGLDTRERLAPYVAFWGAFKDFSRPPVWARLTDDSIDPGDASIGLQAVSTLTRQRYDGAPWALPAAISAEDKDYFSASLQLMVLLCLIEKTG